jgi:hypothetical protein
MGRGATQHVGRRAGQELSSLQSLPVYWQSSALRQVHAPCGKRVAKQLRKRSDGLQPKPACVDWARGLCACTGLSRGHHARSLEAFNQ